MNILDETASVDNAQPTQMPRVPWAFLAFITVVSTVIGCSTVWLNIQYFKSSPPAASHYIQSATTMAWINILTIVCIFTAFSILYVLLFKWDRRSAAVSKQFVEDMLAGRERDRLAIEAQQALANIWRMFALHLKKRLSPCWNPFPIMVVV
jgi:hypothetical protein